MCADSRPALVNMHRPAPPAIGPVFRSERCLDSPTPVVLDGLSSPDLSPVPPLVSLAPIGLLHH